MSLATAKYFKDGEGSPLQFNPEAGWQEIGKGLALITSGYLVLLVGGVLGPLLLWLALDGDAILDPLGAVPDQRDALLLFGMVTVGLTAVLSYGLVLAGQWRCLMYAPERQNAKELMYVCINMVFLASVLNMAAIYVDGGRTYAALQHGWDAVSRLDPFSPGMLVQVASAALGLVSSLFFSQFLRTVAGCFNDRARVRGVDFNLAFVGLLLGGSAGTLFYVQKLALQLNLLPWLAGGWLFCFAWHLMLVRGVRHCVRDGLAQAPVPRGLPAPKSAPGVMPIHSLSGLRRLARKNAEH
jgi:hypothetical protein